MLEQKIITSRNFDEKKGIVKKLMRSAGVYAKAKDFFADPDLIPESGVKILKSLEDGFAVYLAAYEKIADAIDSNVDQQKAAEKSAFANVMSLYLASSFIGQRTKETASRKEVIKTNRSYQFDVFDKEKEGLVMYLANLYSGALSAKDGDTKVIKSVDELAVVTEETFKMIAELCLRKKEKYAALIDEYRLEELELDFGFIKLKGFSPVFGQTYQSMDGAPDLEDIVGNDELKKEGLAAMENALSYDFEEGSNPVGEFPRVYLIVGEPGGGKTSTIKALIKKFLQVARENNIPAAYRVIKTTDFATAFQYETANNLEKIFKEEVFKGDKAYVVYMPDIDTIFSARKQANVNKEDIRTLGVFFDILDGTLTPGKGKGFYVILTDTNCIEALDEAELSRLKQRIVANGPQTAEDYAKLFRIKLKDEFKEGFVKINDLEWKQIGEKSFKYHFSGRNVDSIAIQLAAEIKKFEKPEGWFKMRYAEKKEFMKKACKTVKASALLEKIESYSKFEREQEEKTWQKEKEARTKELAKYFQLEKELKEKFGGPR